MVKILMGGSFFEIRTAWPNDGLWRISYVYLNGRPLARVLADYGIPRGDTARLSLYYYHLDHLGTPLAMTDGSREVVWSTQYMPFGETCNMTSVKGLGNDIRFPGQWHDTETDLHYNWHRYYKPQLGRYIQPDPIGLTGGFNLYAYASGSPLRFCDPLGLQYGTGYGREALDYWAGLWTDPNVSLGSKADALTFGLLSALWTPETYLQTTVTLLAGAFAVPFLAWETPLVVPPYLSGSISVTATNLPEGCPAVVTGVTAHGGMRMAERGLTETMLREVISNPARVVRGIDEFGRVYFHFSHNLAEVFLNPNGKVITVIVKHSGR